ncbi:MAG: hypothetical protein WCY21_06385 [Candidatus Cloacimonadaceae bacterium]|jgi:hypothetical protein
MKPLSLVQIFVADKFGELGCEHAPKKNPIDRQETRLAINWVLSF